MYAIIRRHSIVYILYRNREKSMIGKSLHWNVVDGIIGSLTRIRALGVLMKSRRRRSGEPGQQV
jgi:hypothetical protein